MDKKIFNMASLILGLMFYILPRFTSGTGANMDLLLVIMPVGIFILSLFSAIKYGKSLGFSFLVMLMFLLSIPIYYNRSALVYVFIYGLLSLVGNQLSKKDKK